MSENFERDVLEHGKAKKHYKVPEGMLEVGYDAWMIYGDYPAHDPAQKKIVEQMLERVVRWQAENGKLPNTAEAARLGRNWAQLVREPIHPASIVGIIMEWQRQAYLAPEPEAPEALKDLLWEPYTPKAPTAESQQLTDDLHNNGIYEAYRRGLEIQVERKTG